MPDPPGEVTLASMTRACIFCAIAAGEAPASFIHTDRTCMAFLTLRPTRPGEFTVVPRAHVDHFTDLDDATAAHLMVTAQRLARAARVVLNPLRMGYVVHGFGVAHAHLNVVPQHAPTDIVSARHVDAPGGFRITQDLLPDPSRADLDAMAARLRDALH
ncbi:HIT family protein [Jannaschia marina]|uniref:HIT family protein n=1 Tax=Jannaschia marina TaxID=2741674 RepID=UPI0015CCDBB6|nr:HIT family protein [Jannaschia marina]